MSTSKLPPPSIGSLLVEAARLVRQDFRARAQHLGLTQPQWLAVAHLARNPGMTQAALAERLEVHPVTVTQLIDCLEKSGWVRRERHPSDRRAFALYLTDRAEPTVSELGRLGEQTRAAALRGFSKHERATFESFLTRMKTNLAPPP